MQAILRDYVLKLDVQEPIIPASTAWVKIPCVVYKVAEGEEGLALVTSSGDAPGNSGQLFTGGLNRIYKMGLSDLTQFKNYYQAGKFWTAIFAEEWTDQEVMNNISNLGEFDGVCARMFKVDNEAENAYMNVALGLDNFIAFATMQDGETIDASNMYRALGELLSLENLDNRQYQSMPISDNISNLGIADLLFDKRVSFVISDADYQYRLAGFFCSKKPVIDPYITKLFKLDLQDAALVATNLYKPNMTHSAVANVQDYLYQKVVLKYIDPNVIPSITLNVEYNDEGWVALGTITMSQIRALWRYKFQIIKQ